MLAMARRRHLRNISKPSVSLQALTAEVARSSALDESTSSSLRRWVAWMNVSSNSYWLGHGGQLRGVDGADVGRAPTAISLVTHECRLCRYNTPVVRISDPPHPQTRQASVGLPAHVCVGCRFRS